MHILSIGSDRKLFEEGSDVRARVQAYYGHDVESFHIIVFAQKEHGYRAFALGESGTVTPTNSESKWRYVRDATRLGKKILSQRKGDWVITTQDPFESGLVGWSLARKFSLPLQIQVHTDIGSSFFGSHSFLNRLRLLIAHIVLTRATRVRVVSERIAHALTTKYKVSPDHIDVLPIFTRPTPAVSEEGMVEGDPVVAVVARLEPEKDVQISLNVFAHLHNTHPKAHLIVIGDGSLRKDLEKYAVRRGIASSVEFLGWRNDVSYLLNQIDILLVTSQFEGYGRMFIEAALSGCAIVTTDVGIIGEVLKNKMHALVCPVGDEVCLSQALMRVAENRALRLSLVAEARRRVKEYRETDEGKYQETYREILKKCLG